MLVISGSSTSPFFLSQVGNLIKKRQGSMMNYIDGKLKIVGGTYYDDWTGDKVYLKDIEEFDLETKTWSLTDEELIDTMDTGSDNYKGRGIEIPVSMLP